MATLKFNNLQKIYPNHVQAVFDFNLEIKDKEFIVFVGPSGCGKSTTLRMVAGLEDISDGELFIDNKLINFVDPKDRNIAMVFQSYALYPHMTVYNNMAFSLKIRKSDRVIYEDNSEISNIDNQITELRKKMMAVMKKNSKHPNDKELEKNAIEIKKEIEKLFKQQSDLEKPIRGISETLISRYSKKKNQTEKDIKKLEKQVTNGDAFFQEEKAKVNELNVLLENKNKEFKTLKETGNEKELKTATKSLKKFEAKVDKATKKNDMNFHVLSSFKIELASKKRELEEIIKNIEFYQNTEIDLIKYRHMTKNEIFKEVLRASEILDLFKYLDRKPAALSGGQRQRVALGRAIVRKPKVFLMDEPLSNLDAKLRTQTRTEIAHIHKEVGATTIYVTHDQVEALTLADRIVIMKDGRVQQVCTPAEAYNEPANIFVGGFIGSPAMNFIEGKFDGKVVNLINGKEEIKLVVTKKQASSLKGYVNKNIVVGIRPEFIHLENEFNSNVPTSKLSLKYLENELIGNELIIYFDINGKKFAAKTSAKANFEINKKYDFIVETENIHFFNKETTLVIK